MFKGWHFLSAPFMTFSWLHPAPPCGRGDVPRVSITQKMKFSFLNGSMILVLMLVMLGLWISDYTIPAASAIVVSTVKNVPSYVMQYKVPGI